MQRFIRKTLLSLIGVLVITFSHAWAAAPPLNVSLSTFPSCPIFFDWPKTLKLTAQVTEHGRLSPQTLRGKYTYRFSVSRFTGTDPFTYVIYDGPRSQVDWAPTMTGVHSFTLTVRKHEGASVAAQATVVSPNCDIRPAVLRPVKLQANPPSGQAVAPPPHMGIPLSLRATMPVVSMPPAAYNQFDFTIYAPTGKQIHGRVRKDNYQDRSASWTPFDTVSGFQPQVAGVYRFQVVADIYVSVGGNVGQVLLARGSDEIRKYVANPAPAGPPQTSQVTLTPSPSSPALTGNITFASSVSVPGNPQGVSNKFQLSYTLPSAPYDPVQTGSTQVTTAQNSIPPWKPNPQPPPGMYKVVANVETRRSADNALIATGSKEILNYVVTSDPTYPYGWLYPITTQNTAEPVGMKIVDAEDTIAGNSIKAITSDPNVRVRANNKSCAQCHSGYWPEKTYFCNKVPSFVNNQGEHNGDTILKNLFNNWRGRNCPY